MPRIDLHEPWRSFLLDLDGQLSEPVELHCLGGFVVSELYGLSRGTADLDVLVVKLKDAVRLAAVAGRDSALAKKHRVYLDPVAVADVPEDYETRLVDYDVAGLRHIRLRALERHDLALAKLTRNYDRDREDVRRLAAGPGLDAEEFRRRLREGDATHAGAPGA